ncbi:hypothetical protein [Enterovirga rhinocerotis]|uniref:Uncharacterized protein n=1 Tax=Enterovirga rhinocerotis TaxID=1339210 RepID=A0A4V6PZP0_9HYPH|nr:hypothetical protein [Enterovirga rhinocerotis]TDR94859.1 hypothetical protein EV668_2150 [Enterovirga rhinocerotis]
MRFPILTLAAALAVATPLAALAHGPAKGGKTVALPATGPNGGAMASADGHPIEMVASDTELTFYIQDEDGKPMATKGLTGRAIVTQGGKNATVSLAASEPNQLKGPLAAPLAAGAKIVFSARIHGHGMQARFEKK